MSEDRIMRINRIAAGIDAVVARRPWHEPAVAADLKHWLTTLPQDTPEARTDQQVAETVIAQRLLRTPDGNAFPTRVIRNTASGSCCLTTTPR